MPHCILEYSSNVIDQPDMNQLLHRMHNVLMEAGTFRMADFKSRVIRHDVYFIGDGANNQAFVSLDLQVMAGKSDEQKVKLSKALVDVLQEAFAKTLKELRASISVQVSDVHKASYSKIQSPE